MTADNAGTAELKHSADFNANFLGWLIASGAVSIFFLLYFNRVFASFVSWGLKTWVWHQYRIYIDIKALQISLLGGRVFFTGLRYHGNNETILVQNGHVTWSYWLRRVRQVELEKSDKTATNESTGCNRSSKLPCRINVSLSGLEWYIYNRLPAYDGILAELADEGSNGCTAPLDRFNTAETLQAEMRRRQFRRCEASENLPTEQNFPKKVKSSAAVSNGHGARRPCGVDLQPELSAHEEPQRQHPDVDLKPNPGLPLLLQILPVKVDCHKAAVVIGNENCRSVLTIKAEAMSVEIDACDTETSDPYRQLYKLSLVRPILEIRENQDFREDQLDRARREKREVQHSPPPQRRHFYRRQRRRLLGRLRSLIPFGRTSVESFSAHLVQGPSVTNEATIPGSSHWQGLSRYLDDETDGQRARWASVEYAAQPTIFECAEASLAILWDVVGKVGAGSVQAGEKTAGPQSNINGAEPPAWAINLSIKGGSFCYGPWADRQRAELQRVFVPVLCKDASPAQRLPVGADRIPTQFKIFVELEDEAIIRIPVRESSKNWRWKGKEPGVKPPDAASDRKARTRSKKAEQAGQAHQRSYGWLDIRIAANTSVSYIMDMQAGPSGYSVTLAVDVPWTEISSSINHELLWKSGRQRISCDLSTPLRWNGLRQWHFDIDSKDLELYVLRDHVFLLIDMLDDWTSGPPAEYLVFTPYRYYLDFRLRDVKVFLNVNDANIIDNPTDMDDNTYVILSSPLLQCTSCIPIDVFRPSKNDIPFDLRAETAAVALHVPPWNTQASFLASKEIGQIENLVVEGGYHYNSTTSSANIDTLVLNLSAQSATATLHGFVIRYFLKLKDNYLGDDVHFRTLEEYQNSLRLKAADPDVELADKAPPKMSNDLDVMLSVKLDDPRIFLPANLYSSSRCIQIDTANVSADLRFTNYYMDLNLVLAPLSLSLARAEQCGEPLITATSGAQLFVDGVDVYGHRLFGIPPTESTYLCNWDLSVGAITGECSVDFLIALINGGKDFVFSFDDDENALISYSSIVFYDVTFLRAFVKSVVVWLRVEEAAFQLSTGSIDVNFNDWARTHYSKRCNIKIPDIKVSCINSESATRHRSRSAHDVKTDALLQTSIQLATIGRKLGFSSERRRQQELVRREDQRTHRTTFLRVPGVVLDDFVPDHFDPPAQSVPLIPQPTKARDVRDEGASSRSSTDTARQSRSLNRKSSFPSLSSSRPGSIRKPRDSSIVSRGRTRLRDIPKPSTTSNQSNAQARPPSRSLPTRELSGSTRQSGFYSAQGDQRGRHDLSRHDTVAFSSQFFAPDFPLGSIRPDTLEAIMQNMGQEEAADDERSSICFDLNDVDPDILSEDFVYSSTMLVFPTGLSAFFNTTALRQIAALLAALQFSDPEDLLDTIQMGAMTNIFDMQKAQKMRGFIKDLMVRLPRVNVRFINSSDLDSPSLPQEEQDQYDVRITKLALASRTQTIREDGSLSESHQTHKSFHLRLGSSEVSAAERISDADDLQVAILAQMGQTMVSLASRDVTYLDADVDSVRVSTASENIEYLASLIQRTSILASEMTHVFRDAVSREANTMKFLTHRLVKTGQSAPDSAFMIRPSAVLRSAPKHLRTHDSWKLAMRLRQMWASLDSEAQKQVRTACLGLRTDLAVNTRQEVLSAFQQWRSWDLGDLSQSVLLNRIYGQVREDSSGTDADDKPQLAVVRVRQMQFVLDPGPKHNELSTVEVTVRAETRRPSSVDASAEKMGKEPAQEALTILNVYSNEMAVKLNWNLCELAEDVLKLINRMQSRARPKPIKLTESTPAPSKVVGPHTIHCVFASGRGSASFDAINLHFSSFGIDTKGSLLVKLGSSGVISSNLILNCDSVAWKMQSHAQKLIDFVLEQPSIFVSHELQATGTTDLNTIKATASNKSLGLTVRQDPIALVEVLDLLVRDEFAQLYRLKDKLPPSFSGSKQDYKNGEANAKKKDAKGTGLAGRLSTFRVNAAVFMEQYTISVPLLRSLMYTIKGTVARVAMAANFGREIIVDFDVKENMHDMQVRVNKVDRSISLLQIPPTNGRISSSLTGTEEHTISVFASLELVQLDASAVYSLLSALNRPEISSTINDLQQETKIVQEHLMEILGHAETAFIEQPQQPPASAVRKGPYGTSKFMYAVHLTFAGLKVFGNSPTKSELAPNAYISFVLKGAHLRIANQIDRHGPLLQRSEAHIHLRHMAFEILKGDVDLMSSCGSLAFGAIVTASSQPGQGDEATRRCFHVKSEAFHVKLSPDTVSTVVDVLGYMGDKIKDLDTSRELEYLRKLRQSKPHIAINDAEEVETDLIDTFFSSVTYTVEVCNIQISWLVTLPEEEPCVDADDLVISLQYIEFGTRTRNSARLTIQNFQAQMVPPFQKNRLARSLNSALLPEAMFNIAHVSTAETRRLAFQAVGKSLDLRLTSGFITPGNNLKNSIELSMRNVQRASLQWNPSLRAAPSSGVSRPVADASAPSAATSGKAEKSRVWLGSKRFESFLVDADFAGATVYLTSKQTLDDTAAGSSRGPGRAGFSNSRREDDTSSTVLRSPGLAFKMEYRDPGNEDPSLYAEVKVDASSNILYPAVLPMIVDISDSVKEAVSSHGDGVSNPARKQEKERHRDRADCGNDKTEEERPLTVDPSAVLGRMKLNLGLRIRRQEFALSCQPHARVAATASFEDVYFTANTVRSVEQGNFFAIAGVFTKLHASVQHVYSRESTGSFDVDSIELSLMNSKHVSGVRGVSAILKLSPMQMTVNAKQLQDFLLFREIWTPGGGGEPAVPVTPTISVLAAESSGASQQQASRLAQRCQQVAATAAFPWTATVSMAAVQISVDLGQALGKAAFSINDFWVSSKKTSDWEQNLCFGFGHIGVESTGRMSSFVALQDLRVRTLIQWPAREEALSETPLVQASVGIRQFGAKLTFDYQAFLVAHVTRMEFLMFNIRRSQQGGGDRLVATLDGDAVQIFGTTASAAQSAALYQAFQRLVQERKASFVVSLKEMERFLKPKSPSSAGPAALETEAMVKRIEKKVKDEAAAELLSPITLDTDVVVTLKALNLGVFPSTFLDHQVLKMEAMNAQARFSATLQRGQKQQRNLIHSVLGLSLGQLRIGLASVRETAVTQQKKTVGELSVQDVVQSATNSRGGTILKVPKVQAVMETWQEPRARRIDYIFKSAFEGKVEVGWNYSRVSFIRGMWATHTKALAQTWGRELPSVTAIRVTGVPGGDDAQNKDMSKDEKEKKAGYVKNKQKDMANKITAEVKVPQSRYEYVALEPPVIETPQLRDMGEATPPLEWIGLHRERLPNLTHQIVIVALLELAGEVGDAYSRILGSS